MWLNDNAENAEWVLRIIHLIRAQNFPKNLPFLPLDTRGKKWKFLGKFCVRTKWMIPWKNITNTYHNVFSPKQINKSHDEVTWPILHIGYNFLWFAFDLLVFFFHNQFFLLHNKN